MAIDFGVSDQGFTRWLSIPNPFSRRAKGRERWLVFDMDSAFLFDDSVLYEGKVFEAGVYPDKDFAIGLEELNAKAAAFAGVDLDLEHSAFKDVLGNKLGRLESLCSRNGELIGRLRIPKWLHDLAGGRLKTSLSFDPHKNIVGCALTLHPRIPDAMVAAAFSRAAGLADSPPIKETKRMPQSLKERLRTLFGAAPEATEQAGIDPEELDRVEFQRVSPALDPAIQAQLAEFKAINDRLLAAQLNTAATQFADDVVRSAKAVPAQREHLIALFKSAACADGNGAAQFSAEGQIATGANLTALRNLFKDAQPHSLFSTQILNADPNADSQAPDPSMVEKLRGATRLGQMTTRQERA